MIGQKTSTKEAKHKIRLLAISVMVVLALSLLFFIISAISGTGVKKASKKTKVEDVVAMTEDDIVLFNPNRDETTQYTGETFPTV